MWVDAATEQFVVCDEPYHSGPEFLAEREAWAHDRALAILAPEWPGMYAPSFSALYLLAQRDFAPTLATIVDRLNRLPDPPAAIRWSGESVPYSPVFVSPGRQASGRIKRSRPYQVYPGMVREGSIAYGRTFVGMQWRPHGKMPLESHKRVGGMLKRLQDLGVPSPAWHRIESVRSELDEWIQREYTASELPQDEFSEMYYGTSKAKDTNRLAMMSEVVDRLKFNYPNCGPLRLVLRTLASIRRTIETHEAKKQAQQPDALLHT